MEKETKQPELDFLFTKKVKCPVCEAIFEDLTVRSTKLRRMQPDFDLRPRFQNIDALKYEVRSCPHCGYSAMERYFEHPTKTQIKLIKENICLNFIPSQENDVAPLDYEQAVRRFQLALYNSQVKKAKISERAYISLKIAWLYRSMREQMPENTKEEKEKKQAASNEEEKNYKTAYEGLKQAVSSEDFPICGMDNHTMDYLLGCMACHFKEYSYASKAISNILASQTADHRIKDKALDVKQEIIRGMKEETGK